MIESGRVPRKGRICASNEKLSVRVLEKGRISVSTGKMVESGRVPGKDRICATIQKLSGRVSEKGRISLSTRNW